MSVSKLGMPDLRIIEKSAPIHMRAPRKNIPVSSQTTLPVTVSKPFVIITLGPTGAGKTGLVNKTIIRC